MIERTPEQNRDLVRRGMVGSRFAELDWVAETGSTNTDLAHAVRAGDAREQVLVADHQRAGRGRVGRRWEAPAGSGLLMSVAVELDPADLDRAGLVTVAAALAVADAAHPRSGVEVGLRWPNDVLARIDGGVEGKLAGVLAELVEAQGRRWVVVGAGTNVDLPTDFAPAAGFSPPVDLAQVRGTEPGRPPDRAELAIEVLGHLARRLDALDGLVDELAARCWTLGREVTVTGISGSVTGRAVGLDERAALLVDTGRGRIETVIAGDVG